MLLTPQRLTLQNPIVRNPVLYEDGIHLDFPANLFYTKVPGQLPVRGAFTDLFAFTGDNLSMYRGPNGRLVASQTNVPRIEYDANGQMLGLLVEGARTNLLTQSQSGVITDYPIRDQISVSSSLNLAGISTGVVFGDNSVARWAHKLYAGYVVSTAYTLSVLVRMDDGGAPVPGAGSGSDFEFVIANDGYTTGFTVVPIGNRTYRVSVSVTTPGAILGNNTGILKRTTHSARTFTATAYQLEQAAFPSSYIPTTAGSVARAQDISVRSFGLEFNETKGTSFVEFDLADILGGTRGVFSRASAGRMIYTVSDPNIRIFDGTSVANSPTTPSIGIMAKVASAYDAGGIAITSSGQTPGANSFDGVMGTGASIWVGSIDGGSPLYGHIRRFDYWPERKPNAELIQRTR